MKTLIVYYSETGNTEKIANAIAELFKIKPVKIEKAAIKTTYDLIFVGTPVHAMQPNNKVKEFLDKLPSNKIKFGAGFCTMHFAGAKSTLKTISKKMQKKGIKYIGGFSCKGQSRLFGNLGPRIFIKGRPNKNDIKKAKEFAEKIKRKIENELKKQPKHI